MSDSSGWVDFRAVKEAVTVEAVNHFFTLRLKRVGDEWKGFCPFHTERGKDSSFSFHEEKKAFHCFSCKRKGSVLDFVQQLIAWKENRSCGIKEAGQLLVQVMEEDAYRQRTEAEQERQEKKVVPTHASKEMSATIAETAPIVAQAVDVLRSLGEVSRDVVKGEDAGDWVAVRVSGLRSLFDGIKQSLDGVLSAVEAKAQQPHTPQGKPARRAKKQA